MEADQLPHVALPIEDKGTDGGKGRPSAAHLHGHHPLRLQHGQRPSFSRHLSDLSLRSIPSSLRTERGVNEMSDVLDRLRRLAEEDRREFSKLQDDVWESIGEHEVLEASFDRQFDKQRTFGEAAADTMAAIGGSWGFVVGFAAFIVAWTAANLALPLKWDQYPFILLNLFLSMLAAFQAPVIMMSQNRQAERDRKQSDYTARVNLRAELMTRHINAKLDALMSSSWRRLLESQAIQTALLERVIESQRPAAAAAPAHHGHGHKHGSSKGPRQHHPPSHEQPVGGGSSSVLSTAPPFLASLTPPGRRSRPPSTSPPALAATTDTTSGSDSPVCVYDEGVFAHDHQLQVVKRLQQESSPSREERGRSSSPPPLQHHAEMDRFSTPLASLCLAPPAARLFPGVEIPWYLETEEDEHAAYLLRHLMHAAMDADEQLLVFEHRLSVLGDNFYGKVTRVRLERKAASPASADGLSLSVPIGWHGREDLLRGAAVSPTYVALAVQAASTAATGAGAEAWTPFDLSFDLEFTEGAVLDSIFAGEGSVTLRNALDLPSMTATGNITRLVIHPRGCPCSNASGGGGRPRAPSFSNLGSLPSVLRGDECPMATQVVNGEMPPRFKPSVSASRKDRIAEFWKAPIGRIELSYSPAPLFACVTLRAGQVALPLAVDFKHYSVTSGGSHPPSRVASPPKRQKSIRSGISTPPKKPCLSPPPALQRNHSLRRGISLSHHRDASPPPAPRARTPPPPPPPRLFMVLNPSGEVLCAAVALGLSDQPSPDDSAGSTRSVHSVIDLAAKSPSSLPHNVWLAVSIVQEPLGWLVQLPCELVGPAAVFFYSPDGRLRLRGMLRDDGVAEMESEEE